MTVPRLRINCSGSGKIENPWKKKVKAEETPHVGKSHEIPYAGPVFVL
jgi:hypothetical protein